MPQLVIDGVVELGDKSLVLEFLAKGTPDWLHGKGIGDALLVSLSLSLVVLN